MPKVKTLPSELRRRKHVEMKYGRVTDELFGKCIGMQRTAAVKKLEDPGGLQLWQLWDLNSRRHFSEEEIHEIMGR